MPIVVGVDAGGTGTRAVAADGDDIVGRFVGDAANVRTAGIEASAATIARAIARALAGAQASAIYVGASGAGSGDVAEDLRGALASHFPLARIGVCHDARIALRAAVPAGDGMVLIAGTGSMAYAHVGERDFRSGGFGHLLGDEGSAFAIGRAALRHVLRSYDGCFLPDAFIEAIETALDAHGARSVLAQIHGSRTPVARIASVAPRVLELAGSGDRTAGKLVQTAALDLFELVKSLARQSALLDCEFSLIFAGGLLAENTMLSYLLETRIAGDLPLAHIVKNAPAPEFGALSLAQGLLAGG
ncbi:MAG: hypothetical protein M3R51_07275 [Candidatus Eremiobacteraeota bacterium]|nr:hypothetical protein [Candidatus Eremiobacteraeota bacterium]